MAPLCKRFLDDGFAILQTQEVATQWTLQYDSLRPKIKLEVEMSLEGVMVNNKLEGERISRNAKMNKGYL
jgi:hypothetical protein